jgi:hypothetical protein
MIFFIEVVWPDITVGMGVNKSFKKGGWTAVREVDSTDKIGKWIKGC